MESFLQEVAKFSPPQSIQWLLALVALAAAVYILFFSRNGSQFRLHDAKAEQDVVVGLLAGALLGALTGLLWATWNPIKIVPPYIHLRVFAFLIPLIGIVFGRGAGFIAGYVATMVWAPLAGAFVPLHTPLADGIFVGLTGFIPGWLLRGDRTREQLLQQIQASPWLWYAKSALVCLFTGLFMSFFVALSLQINGVVPFWVAFWAIGVISDTGPMLLFTGPLVYGLLGATRKRLSWAPQF